MVFSNRHVIVVDHDNKVGSKSSCIVKTFECFATAERTVADHGYNPLRSPTQVARLSQTSGKADAGRGVAYRENIRRAFLRIREPGHLIIVFRINKSIHTSCQHLMDIALMGDVVDNLIIREVKNIMHGYRHLDHAEIGADMSAMARQFGQQRIANLRGYILKFGNRE